MSDNGYQIAWLIYIGCSIGLLGCFWYMTHRVYRGLRLPLRAMAVAFLFMPWKAAIGSSDLAPAWLATLFDGLLRQQATLGRAGIPLLLALLVGLLVGCVWLYARQGKQANPKKAQKTKKTEKVRKDPVF